MTTLILTSGGIESTTAISLALKKGETPFLIHFSLGRKSDLNELHYVNSLSVRFRIPIKLVNLSTMQDMFSGVMQREYLFFEGDVLCPSEISFMPGLTELSILFAKQAGFEKLTVGLTKEQLGNDRIKSFKLLEDANNTFHPNFKQVSIYLPFAELEKSDVIKTGTDLGINYNDTWSCLDGFDYHCGVCQSCFSRQEAFKKAGIKDPTKYLKQKDKVSTIA